MPTIRVIGMTDGAPEPAVEPHRRPAPWLAALAAGAGIAAGAAWSPAAIAAGACDLDIVGVWYSGTASPSQRIVLDFAEDGWVTLLAGPHDSPVRQYEMLGAVEYSLGETSIDFSAHRGIEMFPRGSSSWVIGNRDGESFTTLPASGSDRETVWTRVKTQRYFLTFAAREPGGDGEAAAAFVMWTELDDRRTRRRAIGVHAGGVGAPEARFGRIPEPLASAFARESDDDADTMLRLELGEAEFRRTFEIFEAWDVLLKNDLLAEEDPYLHAAELVAGVVQAANRCGPALVGYDGERFGEAVTRPRRYALSAEQPLDVALLELLRHIDRINRRMHVDDEDLEDDALQGGSSDDE